MQNINQVSAVVGLLSNEKCVINVLVCWHKFALTGLLQT
jgi:hypothetical protein